MFIITRRLIVVVLLSLFLVLSSLIRPPFDSYSISAQTECPTISDAQYDAIRNRILRDNGTLSQKYCVIDSINGTCNNKHTGLDVGLAGATGIPILAPVSGEIIKVKQPSVCDSSPLNLSYIILYNSQNNTSHIFLHIASATVTSGSVVAGAQIAVAGSCGVKSIHVHYETRSGRQLFPSTCIDNNTNPFTSTFPDGAFVVDKSFTVRNTTDNPINVAVNGNRVYIPGRINGVSRLIVLDKSTGSLVADIPFTAYSSLQPRQLVLVNNKAYVALNGSNGQVAVVDLTTNSVVRYIAAGTYCQAIATGNGKLYVSNAVQYTNGSPALIYVIDLNTSTVVSTIATNGSNTNGLAVDSVANKLYFVNRTSKQLGVVNLATNAVSTYALVNEPIGVVVKNGKVFVALDGGNLAGTLKVFSSSNLAQEIASIALERNPYAISASTYDNSVFVTNLYTMFYGGFSGGSISVINASNNSLSDLLPLSANPTGVTVDSSNGTPYVVDISRSLRVLKKI